GSNLKLSALAFARAFNRKELKELKHFLRNFLVTKIEESNMKTTSLLNTLSMKPKGKNCGLIRMEQLKDIRAKAKTWNKHRNRTVAGWSFYQLQQFVTYKAADSGIVVELINPAYTSQTCHHCLQLGSRSGELFTCLTCGDEHADVNASHVI